MRRVDRRTFLVLTAGAVATAGCTSRSAEPAPPPSAPPRDRDPDAGLRQRVAEAEQALITAYQGALARDPGLLTTLGPILRQHEAHRARVAPGWVPPPATRTAEPSSPQSPAVLPSADPADPASPSPTGPGGTGDPTTGSAPGATTRSGTLAALAAAEAAARGERIAACDAALDPTLARDLCLIGASEAQHATVLERAARGARQ